RYENSDVFELTGTDTGDNISKVLLEIDGDQNPELPGQWVTVFLPIRLAAGAGGVQLRVSDGVDERTYYPDCSDAGWTFNVAYKKIDAEADALEIKILPMDNDILVCEPMIFLGLHMEPLPVQKGVRTARVLASQTDAIGNAGSAAQELHVYTVAGNT